MFEKFGQAFIGVAIGLGTALTFVVGRNMYKSRVKTKPESKPASESATQ